MTHDPPTVASLRDVMREIEESVPEGGNWCSVEKALTLASIVVALRPKVVVELGVWMGGSAIPIAIALRHRGTGRLVAVDAWSAAASVQGQATADSKWWGEVVGGDGHEKAYQTFLERLRKHSVGDCCTVVRQRADAAHVPASIDVLHHDANHGPQAVLDIERWSPAVRVGGLLVIDDLHWEGGHVERARARARDLGFVDMYALGTGCVMQRVRAA